MSAYPNTKLTLFIKELLQKYVALSKVNIKCNTIPWNITKFCTLYNMYLYINNIIKVNIVSQGHFFKGRQKSMVYPHVVLDKDRLSLYRNDIPIPILPQHH